MGLTPQTYSDVFDWLEREHVRYVVLGGVAVVLRGYVRPIADLDFAVEHTPEEMSRAMGALYALGFVPSIPLPLSALTMMRMFDSSQREINVFVRLHIPFAELWAASEKIPIGQGVVRVASLEHLLRLKRIDGRPRDLQDINGLLALETSSHGQSGASTAADDDEQRDETG
jgi:hypothetical protein